MRVQQVVCLLSLALLLSIDSGACAISRCPEPAQPRSPIDSWLRPPPPASSGKWYQIDPAQVYMVDPIMLSKAQALLARTPIVKLSVEQAKSLVGKQLVAQAAKTPTWCVPSILAKKWSSSMAKARAISRRSR